MGQTFRLGSLGLFGFCRTMSGTSARGPKGWGLESSEGSFALRLVSCCRWLVKSLAFCGFCARFSLKFKYGGWVPERRVPRVREPSRSCTAFMAEPSRSQNISRAVFCWLVWHKPSPAFKRWVQGPPNPALSGKSVSPHLRGAYGSPRMMEGRY